MVNKLLLRENQVESWRLKVRVLVFSYKIFYYGKKGRV